LNAGIAKSANLLSEEAVADGADVMRFEVWSDGLGCTAGLAEAETEAGEEEAAAEPVSAAAVAVAVAVAWAVAVAVMAER
jgi:hypothetical protein